MNQPGSLVQVFRICNVRGCIYTVCHTNVESEASIHNGNSCG